MFSLTAWFQGGHSFCRHHNLFPSRKGEERWCQLHVFPFVGRHPCSQKHSQQCCLGPIDLICVTSAFKGSWQSKEQDCRNWLQLIIIHNLGLGIPLPLFFKCSALKEEGGLGTGYDTQVSTTASIYGAYISPQNIHH